MPKPLSLIATCSLGLEELLAEEVRALGVEAPRVAKGVVAWRGDWASCWRANWRLRTANRVLVELATWPAPDGDALAAGARRLVLDRPGAERGSDGGADRAADAAGWGGVSAYQLFDPARTFSIRATVAGSRMRDARWVALKVKDGIADAQREAYGRRASVDREAPALPFRLRLAGDQASLLLDTSGEPLDRRGYRLQVVAAPLREQLAAACVLAAGVLADDWNGKPVFADPMCGSGTLLAEAGWIAIGKAPGALRRKLARENQGAGWAFERFPGFDAARFREVRGEPIRALCSRDELRLFGSDTSASALNAAESNLRRASLRRATTLTQADAFETDAPRAEAGHGPEAAGGGPVEAPVEAPGKASASSPPPGAAGLVLINPPYGERMAEEPEQWKRLGDLLKQRWSGWRAVVIAGDAGKGKHIGLRPRLRLPVKNGPLDARILVFDLY